MRVFVTGATGFLGRSLVPELRRRGHAVTCLVRSTSRPDTVSTFEELGCSFHVGDVTEPATFRGALRGHDAVVHLAALVRLGDLPLDAMRRINVQATENVLAAARAEGVRRVLHASSIAALGKTFGQVADETWEHPGFFTSPYERTKWEAQRVALRYAQEGMHVVCALPAVVFGPRDPNFGWLFRAWARRRVRVLPAPETTFSFVHVEDLAQGLAAALERGRRGELYLFAQGNVTLRTFFEHCSRATGIRMPRWQPSARLVRALLRLAWPLLALTRLRRLVSKDSLRLLGTGMAYRSDKAKRELGWAPRALGERLEETARYYHEKYGRRGLPRPAPPSKSG